MAPRTLIAIYLILPHFPAAVPETKILKSIKTARRAQLHYTERESMKNQPMKIRTQPMKIRTWTVVLGLLLISALFLPRSAACMEKLDNEEMKGLTGQAGISAASSNVVLEYFNEEIKFEDTHTLDKDGNPLTPNGYVKFGMHALMVSDDLITFDVGVFNDLAMVSMTHESLNDPVNFFHLENVSVRNHNTQPPSNTVLGDIQISNIQIFKSRLNLFPPGGSGNTCGIQGAGGVRMNMENLVFNNPNDNMSVSVSGAMFGAAFTGSPENPEDWAFDDGLFCVGSPYYFQDYSGQQELGPQPFTFDITHDGSRPGDFQAYMALNLPVQGSIRIQNIASEAPDANFDMGPIAIDGIRLYKNEVEFPGRGIGN